jgi:hypothetical protein
MSSWLGSLSAEIRITVVIAIVVGALYLLYRQVGSQLTRSRLTQKRREGDRDARGFVRRSDLTRLTSSQEKQRNEAMTLLEQGKAEEAAKIFEAIGLHRDAVDTLERAGQIDAACAILLRLQRPNRAAAVFLRHHMFERAAECFMLSNQPEDAAKAYMEAAREEPQFFEKAGRVYESVRNLDMALKAYALGKKADRVTALAFQDNNWPVLAEFMSDHEDAQNAMQHLRLDQLKTLVENVPINQKNVQTLAMWSALVRKMDFIAVVINKLIRHNQWLTLYWSMLKPDLAEAITKSIVKGVDAQSKEGRSFLVRNAHALYEGKLFPLAAQLYVACNRHAIVAKCYALAGDLTRCQEALDKSQDEHLLNRFEEAVRSTAHFQARSNQGGWHPETLKAVQQAFNEVDPYTEEQAAKSPFVMVA